MPGQTMTKDSPSSARALTWRDLPLLRRYRGQALAVDTRHATVGGSGLLAGGLLALLSPSTGLAGAVAAGHNAPPLLALAERAVEYPTASLLYLAPRQALLSDSPPALAPLIEALVAHPALRGVHALLAEAPLHAGWSAALREAGFRAFARHRIWQWHPPQARRAATLWHWPSAEERWAAERLYADLTPPLARRLLPSPAAWPTTVVYTQGGQVRGVARWHTGPKGVWVWPLLHPDLESPCEPLAALAAFVRSRGRPLFFAIHDSQMWVESALENLGATASQPYALFARWMTVAQTVTSPAAALTLAEAPPATLFAPRVAVPPSRYTLPFHRN